jgi:hypothetical protein
MANSFRDRLDFGVKRVLAKVFSPQESPQSINDSCKTNDDLGKADLLKQAIVLNSNEDLVNPEFLALLLHTIFENQTTLIESLSATMQAELFTGNIVAAEHRIEQILLEKLDKKEADAPMAAALFYKHKVQSQLNEKAYSPKGRTNPEAVFWPNPTDQNRPRSLHDQLPFVQKVQLISKSTPIASIGSCFAVEIAYALQREEYNYIVKEPNKADDGSYWFKDYEVRPFATSSAAWGIHFNCPSFLQLVEKAFGYRRPAKILWTNTYDGMTRYCDPFREEVEFPSIEAFEKNYESHINAVRAVFLEAEVLVLTLGLNEVWYFKPDGSVFSRSPWRTAPSLVEHRILTVEENVQDLQKMLDILRQHNPKIKLIVTLSPVPLHATFLADSKHIVEPNTHSKAVLRVAAEEFVERNTDVFYFPSFELVTTCIDNAWDADQRHVSRHAVDRVMTMFKQMYCHLT